VDLADALVRLDVNLVHAEGGPTLNAALLTAGLVDEVNLTIAPRLVGGPGQRLTGTAGNETLQHMELAHVCDDDGFLFLRYVRAHQRGSTTR
jgi:riboflavin biosynthesis pyrimidine reductase